MCGGGGGHPQPSVINCGSKAASNAGGVRGHVPPGKNLNFDVKH